MINSIKLILQSIIGTRFERYQVHLPYALYVAGITFIAGVPIIALPVSLFGVKGTIFGVGTWWGVSILGAMLGAIIIFILLGFFGIIGYLSGYRHYSYSWSGLDEKQFQKLSEHLRIISQEQKFHIVWENDKKEFVALKDFQLELSGSLFGLGGQFPVRLAFLACSRDAMFNEVTLYLQCRWLVLYDTGERMRCKNIGEELVRQLEAL